MYTFGIIDKIRTYVKMGKDGNVKSANMYFVKQEKRDAERERERVNMETWRLNQVKFDKNQTLPIVCCLEFGYEK